MRSFIKIYGPPVLKAINTLEKVAIDMPEVCIMDSIIAADPSFPTPPEAVADYAESYFSAIPARIKIERCKNIISKFGEMLGEYDFFFEWFTDPSMEQLNGLIEKIDEALKPLGCKYTITTK